MMRNMGLIAVAMALLCPMSAWANGDANLTGKWGIFGGGPGQFHNPTGIAIDGGGNIYIADNGNNRIQKFTAPLTIP